MRQRRFYDAAMPFCSKGGGVPLNGSPVGSWAVDRRLPLPPRSADDRPRRERLATSHSLKPGVVAEARRSSFSFAQAPPSWKSPGLADESSPAALYLALRLARHPGLVTKIRSEEWPGGMARLIRTAGGLASPDGAATDLAGEDPTFVRAAAVYYLEQTLWSDGNNHHQALGLHEGASEKLISERAWLLMEWLHPYVGSGHREAMFADRVLDAWTALKANPQTRSASRL